MNAQMTDEEIISVLDLLQDRFAQTTGHYPTSTSEFVEWLTEALDVYRFVLRRVMSGMKITEEVRK